MTTSARLLSVTGLLTLATVAVFLLWPDFDLAVARLLYLGDNRFVFSHSKAWVFYDHILRPGFVATGFALGLWALWMAWHNRARRGLYLRRIAFVLLVVLLGPILIVEAGLKSHSGRARPTDVSVFEGEQTYSPPLVFADQCDKNCSFVSGDAAVAFTALALALLTVRRRGLWIALSIGLGLAIGAWRIAVGGHFLSDVIFAGLIVAAVTALCFRFILERQNTSA